MLDLGGTYRAWSPKETLAKIEPLMWKPFGITRVANITGLDNINIPTYIAVRPFSKMLTTSQGKGITHDLAKISAIMESIESWHGENLKAPDLYGSYNALKNKHRLIDIEKIALHGVFKPNATKLNELELPWAKGIELNSDQEIYFPMPILNLDSVNPGRARGIGYFTCTTNGLASGNTYEEALCHGLYEVIERHCWEEAELKAPCYLDLSTIDSPHLQQLFSHLDFDQIKLDVLDMTNDFNVPAYLAYLSNTTGLHATGTYIGSGAHLSSSVAISRAITEAIQARVTIISGARDDLYPAVYQSVMTPQIMPYDLKKNFASKNETSKSFKETAVPGDFLNCINHLLQSLRTEFDEIIVYNHTRPEFGIPVVHVVIPGIKFDLFKHNNRAYLPEQLVSDYFHA